MKKPNLKKELESANAQLTIAQEQWRNIARKNEELVAALKPFLFKASPKAFQGFDGNMTSCMICDTDVQRVRALLNF
jgi:hypothetical protein